MAARSTFSAVAYLIKSKTQLNKHKNKHCFKYKSKVSVEHRLTLNTKMNQVRQLQYGIFIMFFFYLRQLKFLGLCSQQVTPLHPTCWQSLTASLMMATLLSALSVIPIQGQQPLEPLKSRPPFLWLAGMALQLLASHGL
jgi:hypothetical protein